MDGQIRYDVGVIAGTKMTPQGFLKVKGNMTRIGVLPYRRADGSIFHELRHPDEVFKADSVESLIHAPVTRRHPPGLVTVANVKQYQIGLVADARVEDRFIGGDVIVQDSDSIGAIGRRELCELSPGYTCKLEERAGMWGGIRYDGIQRGIVYNHLAIGPRAWGRSGPEVSLHLDANHAIERYDSTPVATYLQQQRDLRSWRSRDIAERARIDEWVVDMILSGWQAPTDAQASAIARAMDLDVARVLSLIPEQDRRSDGRRTTGGRRSMETTTITLDGVEYEAIPRHAAQVITREVARSKDAVAAATKRADEAEGKADALAAEVADLKAKLDAASNPEAVAKAVRARVSLEQTARPFLGAEAKLDAMSDREIRCAVIAKTDTAFDPKDRSDEYVAARFDGAIAAAPKVDGLVAPPPPSFAHARKVAAPTPPPAPRADGTNETRIDSSDSAKREARKKAGKVWEQPAEKR